MKHAGPNALAQLSSLLELIRERPGLKEKSVGVFYWKSKAFLHFHEDPAGIFGDLRIGDDFERFPANTAIDRKALLAAIDRQLRD